ncbi:MAG: CehA/McbA family metallohydrolase [Candidatus Omnitrophota bacterium]
MSTESKIYKKKPVNPFQQKGAWYKANLHTHTTASDGDSTVPERIAQYREKGYSVLAITDHRKINDVNGLSSEKFLVLSGIETHPACPNGGNLYHLVCLNVPFSLEFSEDSDANTRIKIARQAGGETIFAHPYWCGHTINELRAVKGYIAVEVYNATCTKIGKGFSSVQWDDLLASGEIVSAVASDDVHRDRDIFMGWTMIKARRLDADSIMEALRAGSFYASCGPTIKDCRIENNEVVLRCSAVKEAHLIGRQASGQSFYADGKKEITDLKCPIDKNWKYVRVEVVDRQGNRAWTNPFIL